MTVTSNQAHKNRIFLFFIFKGQGSSGASTIISVFSSDVKLWFCKQSIHLTVTFSSYIVQFAAVGGFNQTSSPAETCLLALHESG